MAFRGCAGLALVLVLVAAACGGSSPTYTPCVKDGDCPAAKACLNQECKPATACTADSACTDGRVCMDGFCRTAECTQNTDCQANNHCDAHHCVQNQCSTDADCPTTQYCDAGTCKDKQVKTCSADSDCATTELCLDGKCQTKPACTQDTDCPQGTVCEGTSCARACAADTDCATLHKCQSGHCRAQCLSNSTCQQPTPLCKGNLCVPAECTSDSDCQGQYVQCLNYACQTYTPCTTDPDCNDANFRCVQGKCQELPVCVVDSNCTKQGDLCLDGHCRPATSCSGENDCTSDQDCIGGLCRPHVCRGPVDCQSGQVCVGGVCTTGGNPATVYSVVILTPGGPIKNGELIQLLAVALTQSGDEVPGVAFDWNSTNSNCAAVSATGLLTGGTVIGDTYVTAKAHGTTRISGPVLFTNVGDATAGYLRVNVVNAADRTPLAGQTVVLVEGGNPTTATTDTSGVATFTAPAGAADVHVFSSDHDYVSILQTVSADLLVPLPERSDLSKAGGFTGQMTFSGTGEVSMGLAGTSIAGNLLDLNMSKLMGEIFTVKVTLGTYTVPLTLPAQMVLGAQYSGFPITIKPKYYVVGQSGLRTAWCLGGNISFAQLQQVFQTSNIQQILLDLLPFFAMFNHGLKPQQDIFPIPLVVDANDINGNGNTTEMRPDWANFPSIDMDPEQPQTMAVQVTVPTLPSHGGTAIKTTMFLAGGLTPLGFTPLGLNAEAANAGVAAPLVMKLAPAYGGLEVGTYSVLVLGYPTTTGAQLPSDVAAVAFAGTSLPNNVTFESGFLAFPEDATFSKSTRTLVASNIAGATLFKSTIQGATGAWNVYLPAGSGTVTFTLPQPPSGMADLAAGDTVNLVPMKLRGNMTYENLVDFDGEDLDQINQLVVAFSSFQLP